MRRTIRRSWASAEDARPFDRVWPGFVDILSAFSLVLLLIISSISLTKIRNGYAMENDLGKIDQEIARVEGVEVRKDGNSIVFSLQNNVLFPKDKYTLDDIDPAGRDKLKAVGNTVRRILNERPYTQVMVEGHTCCLAYPPNADNFTNWELSGFRASSVVHYLVDEVGIAGEKIMAVGKSQYDPKVPEKTEEDRLKNRRVEIRLMYQEK